MGKLEQEAKIVRRKTNIQKVVLHTIATAGVLSLALLAPNALQVLRMFDGGKTRKHDPRYLIGTAFEKLCARGFIVIENSPDGKRVHLTKEGKILLARTVASSPDSRKKARWDKRWRMVIYDIREERTGTRIKLRRSLQSFGFYKLQNSVWVYPYDCEALLILLKADFKIGRDVLYVIVEKIEHDVHLKEHFGLK